MIRDANIEDLPEMSVLWISMLKEINPTGKPNVEWWRENQKEMMKLDIYYPYVAIVDSKIVGFIIGMLYPDPTTGQRVAFGQEFYVLPECRNDKISEGLYGRLVRMGKSLNADCIEMTCFEGQMDFWMNKEYEVQKYCIRRPM